MAKPVTNGVIPTKIAIPCAMSELEFARARRTLMRRDPRLGELIKRVGRCRLADSRTRDPFGALVRAIVFQQLSGKAAETIHGRVVTLAGGVEQLTPARILELEVAALRTAGVS